MLDKVPPDINSLGLVERIMELEEEFGIEISEDDWLQGAGVPRRGPFPAGSGNVELPLPTYDEDAGQANNDGQAFA